MNRQRLIWFLCGSAVVSFAAVAGFLVHFSTVDQEHWVLQLSEDDVPKFPGSERLPLVKIAEQCEAKKFVAVVEHHRGDVIELPLTKGNENAINCTIRSALDQKLEFDVFFKSPNYREILE